MLYVLLSKKLFVQAMNPYKFVCTATQMFSLQKGIIFSVLCLLPVLYAQNRQHFYWKQLGCASSGLAWRLSDLFDV